MLTLSPVVQMDPATGATDLRRSIDGLAALVREGFTLDPLSGHLFLFRNRCGDRLKILAWDPSGFRVLYTRLEQGTFAWPWASPQARRRCGVRTWRSCSRAWMWHRHAEGQLESC